MTDEEREAQESWLRVQPMASLRVYLSAAHVETADGVEYAAAIRRELARREAEGITT